MFLAKTLHKEKTPEKGEKEKHVFFSAAIIKRSQKKPLGKGKKQSLLEKKPR
jgi:hypothetical protein